MPSITMGSCSSLQGIEVSSKVTMRLDVRGCGGLQQLHLDCPALQVLDADFCASLSDEGLASAVGNIPPLRQLSLSVCCQVSGWWQYGPSRGLLCTCAGALDVCIAKRILQPAGVLSGNLPPTTCLQRSALD